MGGRFRARSRAQPAEPGRAYWGRAYCEIDPSEIVRYIEAAEEGDPEASYWVGCFYKTGYGVHRDLGLAARWWREAAEKGVVRAQVQLAILLEQGTGVQPDMTGAARWYRAAAAQGDMEAQRYLGRLYWEGRGVDRDHGQAIRCWQDAANQGDRQSKYNLALAHWAGSELPRRRLRAVRLFYEASADPATWALMRQTPAFALGARRLRFLLIGSAVLVAGVVTYFAGRVWGVWRVGP
jgi:uncharacterized protein